MNTSPLTLSMRMTPSVDWWIIASDSTTRTAVAGWARVDEVGVVPVVAVAGEPSLCAAILDETERLVRSDELEHGQVIAGPWTDPTEDGAA